MEKLRKRQGKHNVDCGGIHTGRPGPKGGSGTGDKWSRGEDLIRMIKWAVSQSLPDLTAKNRRKYVKTHQEIFSNDQPSGKSSTEKVHFS